MMDQAKERLQIVVDDRERASGVADYLAACGEVMVKIDHLALGDYSVDEAVLFERKTATDFAKSLIDGRLFSQAKRMADSFLRPAYIIEGTSADWSSLGISRKALQGALITLTLIFDIPVFRSTTSAESAQLIVYAGNQLMRLRDPDYLPYRQAKAKRIRNQQLRIVQSLPGIGPDRARRLIERFGTVRACYNASAQELQEVSRNRPENRKRY